jgi:hypothetical protein
MFLSSGNRPNILFCFSDFHLVRFPLILYTSSTKGTENLDYFEMFQALVATGLEAFSLHVKLYEFLAVTAAEGTWSSLSMSNRPI